MWNLFGVADADQQPQSENQPSLANSNSGNYNYNYNNNPAATGTGTGAGAIGTSADDAFSEPECDYDSSPTQLYKLIENKAWDAAICRVQSCPEEARTWVCRREKKKCAGIEGQIRWRLLPIHATCVFRSPLSLIEALIEAYPDGVAMKDVSL